mmetsp:Transcript_16797/g.38805  ORF Transcript_16797/g.38805 Transcript_16797/m.38805 type:complete len:208 (-) Transcript_16797:1958-2581(-)
MHTSERPIANGCIPSADFFASAASPPCCCAKKRSHTPRRSPSLAPNMSARSAAGISIAYRSRNNAWPMRWAYPRLRTSATASMPIYRNCTSAKSASSVSGARVALGFTQRTKWREVPLSLSSRESSDRVKTAESAAADAPLPAGLRPPAPAAARVRAPPPAPAAAESAARFISPKTAASNGTVLPASNVTRSVGTAFRFFSTNPLTE